MIPILVIQLVSIAIIVERVYALFVKRKMNQKMIADGFEESIRRGDLDTAIERARAMGDSGIAKALVAGARAPRT